MNQQLTSLETLFFPGFSFFSNTFFFCHKITWSLEVHSKQPIFCWLGIIKKQKTCLAIKYEILYLVGFFFFLSSPFFFEKIKKTKFHCFSLKKIVASLLQDIISVRFRYHKLKFRTTISWVLFKKRFIALWNKDVIPGHWFSWSVWGGRVWFWRGIFHRRNWINESIVVAYGDAAGTSWNICVISDL